LNNPNEMVRVYMSVAAVEDGTFAIDPVIRRWGMVDDKAIRDGRLYSSKAPLQSLVGVPAYLAARPLLGALGLPVDARHVTLVLRVLGSVLFGVLLAWALIAWCRERAEVLGAEPSAGTALGLALALGTMVYPYALTFTGHVLAAATAGGCFLAVASLGHTAPGSRKWRRLALLAGFLGGAAPFAEYPAALVALPALVAGVIVTPSARARVALVGWLALGGALPFGLGLWSHAALWGSPLATGYQFLENPGYVAVHEKGFFGVTRPKGDAFLGTLFSPGTGLFFFSPVLAVGLLPIARRALFGRGQRVLAAPPHAFGRWIMVAALAGLLLELLFISGHRGWRGGWTLGPRYIIPVVVVLGFGCAEALGHRRLRPWLMTLGAASILLTGPAAALYPHLSDVYTNPLRSFVLPSYLRGEMSYGIAHALGLEGHLANALHLAPLGAATLWVALAGAAREGLGVRLAHLAAVGLGVGLVLASAGEASPGPARAENRRLWGFWEPEGDAPRASVRAEGPRPGLIGTARGSWRQIQVRRLPAEGPPRPCRPRGAPCRYGSAPWQRFGPETFRMDGASVSALFMHPVAKEQVEATIPLPPRTRAATLRYGLSDASMAASNPHPVTLTVAQAGAVIAVAQAGERWGFEPLPLPLTSTTAPLVVRAEVEDDGARVLGFDVEFYDRP
jgi:hypothetical protein